uniref:Uncharacterized LOC100179999 n=1 Tax=Ciona intestinalis TaxID=7719 RepID=F6X628_CIOIN|nr:uncharacterized protein LOC100179999 [Ciona intestinalis]|eukprot:XP_002129327.1 uncharacterized protein LOC100179999 [Ciona intestinalis]
MENSAEYDALLRSVFDSCDTSGNGLINSTEFEELCSQLSLENESSVLARFLFDSTSLIGYEKFKEGLLLLLEGSLSGNDVKHAKSDSLEFSDDGYLDNEDLNDNNLKNISEKIRSEDSDSDVGFGDVVEEKSWIVIDLKESENSRKSEKRKYGRRSRPDLELLGDNAMDSSSNQNSVTHVTSCVEYYADGDGSDWITPDIGPSPDTPTCDSQLDAEDALGAIWLEVIGSLELNINVGELQKLYHALNLTSSCGDVQQLFDVLDDDNDGLISFSDFARQMAVFMTSQSEDNSIIESTPQRRRSYSNKSRQPVDLSTPDYRSTPLVTSQNNSHVTPTSFNNNNTSGFMSSQSPEGSPDSSNGSMTSQDSTMEQNYVGIPPYRRRQRGSQNGTRHSKRRNNKIVSLPHYHPISRRRLEDSPLYFLTGGNGRYVEIDKLKKIWFDDGIEESEEILENLGVNKDDSFSVEVLGEALETELSEHLVHRAICCLYKGGIRHYRSIQEQGSTDSSRSRSVVDNLNIQLQDQEERIERMEEETRRKMEDVKEQYKTELNELQTRLSKAHDQIEQQNEDESKKLRCEVDRLKVLEQTLREEIATLEAENNRLVSVNHQVESRLHAAESKEYQMRQDFDIAYRGMALCNKSNDEQRHHMEVLLDQFKQTSKKLQDENDELMNHLKVVQRRWRLDGELTMSRRASREDATSSPTSPRTSSPTSSSYSFGFAKCRLSLGGDEEQSRESRKPPNDCDVSLDFTNSDISEVLGISPLGKPPNNFVNVTKCPL